MSKRKHTKESIYKEALKYSSRNSFRLGSPKHYEASRKRRLDILDEVCSHMKKLHTKETVKIEALKYKRRSDFQKYCQSGYTAAVKFGILDEVCSHMKKWGNQTKDDIRKEALKYKNRTDFQNGSPSFYFKALAGQFDIIDEVCSHMESQGCFTMRQKYKKGVFLYLIEVEDNENKWIKIGLTTTSTKNRYITDRKAGVKINEIKSIWFPVGTQGYDIEQRLLYETIQFQSFKYNRDGPLEGGCTEMRDYNTKDEMKNLFAKIKPTYTFDISEDGTRTLKENKC